MARAMTMPAQPPRPWPKRSQARVPMSLVMAQPIEARVKIASPSSSGGLRPSRSASGP